MAWGAIILDGESVILAALALAVTASGYNPFDLLSVLPSWGVAVLLSVLILRKMAR